MEKLKLIAFDAEDLAVVSTHVQDAVLSIGDMAYVPRGKRFAALLRRFDWTSAVQSNSEAFERRQSALRFERVMAARVTGLDLAQPTATVSLLAIKFEARAADDPSGVVTLYFAGGGAIQLDVECIEAELSDQGPTWTTGKKPAHPGAVVQNPKPS